MPQSAAQVVQSSPIESEHEPSPQHPPQSIAQVAQDSPADRSHD
jgi:hypothetical protein